MEEIKGTDGTWGVRFNASSTWTHTRKNERPEGCPDWANPLHIKDWQQAGLVCWNNQSKKFSYLNGKSTLHLFNVLRDTKSWDQDGIPVQDFKYIIHLNDPDTRTKPPTNDSADTSDPETKKRSTKGEWIEDLRLPIEALAPLISLLERHEPAIKAMAEREEQQWQHALESVYTILLNASLKGAVTDVDLSKYALNWRLDKREQRFTCDLPPNRATIYSKAGANTWTVDIERPGEPVWRLDFFSSADSALTRAEEHLQKKIAPAAPMPPERPLDDWARELKREYGKRWLDPKRLEPDRITFSVILDLKLKATSFKIEPLSFGGQKQVADQYPTPQQVEKSLNLQSGYFALTQLLGPLDEWYRAVSVTTFRERALAQSEAQRLWNTSAIMSDFQAGRVLCARYGFMEKETSYCTWIGECTNADNNWGEESDRKKHMLHLAVMNTIVATLDIKRFREFLGFSDDVFSDDTLMRVMHERRVKSQLLPAEMRAESSAWLVLDEQRKQDVEKTTISVEKVKTRAVKGKSKLRATVRKS